MRKGCMQCFRKHIGTAEVLLDEIADGYPYRRLAIGNLNEAANEIREFSPELAAVVRAHRIMLEMTDFKHSIPGDAFDRFIDVINDLNKENSTDEHVIPELPEDLFEGLGKTANGDWELFLGDQR